jgi:hypothetical protein
VIDPAETRALIAATLAAGRPREGDHAARRRFIDAW